jgi:hypothetical protein
MPRPTLLGESAPRGNALATWMLDEQTDHVAARLREPVHELVHVIDHSVDGAIEPIWLAPAKVCKWHFSEVSQWSA